MSNFTISIFENKTFFLIMKEMKLFSQFKVKYQPDINAFNDKKNDSKQLVIFFMNSANKKNILAKIQTNNFPSLVISGNNFLIRDLPGHLSDKLLMPFTIINFEKKIINLVAKAEFKKNSFINLGFYTIDKNERKIKKGNLELQLSEKEVNFLILFSKSKKPMSTNFILENAWNYSLESETHTVETHIHRLRKKIFDKFGDGNFIKNNNKGYFV
jgi:hypothetical protein